MYQYRLLTTADIGVLLHHRRQMFGDMGQGDHPNLGAMLAAFEVWAEGAIERGYYSGFVAEDQGQVVASLSLIFPEFSPRLQDLSPTRPYIFNIYTEPQHRRKGLARGMLELALGLCRQRGVKLVALHYSADGKALYEAMGFKLGNEMTVVLD